RLVRDQPRQHALLRLRLVLQGRRARSRGRGCRGSPPWAEGVHPPGGQGAMEAARDRPRGDSRRLRRVLLADDVARARGLLTWAGAGSAPVIDNPRALTQSRCQRSTGRAELSHNTLKPLGQEEVVMATRLKPLKLGHA